MDYRYFVPSQHSEFTNACLKILKTEESGVILFPPNSGRSNRRINDFIENNKSGHEAFKFDLTFNEVDDISDFEDVIHNELELAKKKKVALLISNAHTLIANRNYLLMNQIVNLPERVPNLQIIFIFNIDVTNPDIAAHIKSSIFSNVIYFPLYNRKDTLGFIDHLVRKWSIKLSELEKERIANECNGYYWLIKQAVRSIRDNPDIHIDGNLLEFDGVKLALEQLYSSLFVSEREVLQSLVLGRKIEGNAQRHSLEYLTKIGFVKNEQVTIPLLISYLRKYLPKMTAEVTKGLIHINFVNVESHFSRKERKIFKLLINKKNEIVSRDELSKAIWPVNTEESYSDWAVDRLLARLRSKLQKLGMPKEAIKTLRNQGYMLID